MDQVIVIVAQYFVVLSVLIAGVFWLRLPAYGKWTLGTAGLLGGLVALGLIAVAGSLYHDRRPFVTEHVRPLFPHPADNGFPSDHATLTMFIAVCVLFYSRAWGSALTVNALLVGIARVLARVHSPLDIAAGYVLGALAAAAAVWAAPRIVRLIPLPSAAPPGAQAVPQPRRPAMHRRT